MSVLHQSVTIANGASLSGELDLTDRRLLSVEVPSSWTAAGITIAAARDDAEHGGVYVPVKNQDGTDIVLTAAVSTVVVVSSLLTMGLRWIKLRSGTPGVAVNQGADRVLWVATCEDDKA